MTEETPNPEARIAQALDFVQKIYSPPCYGPTPDGTYMVDMSTADYQADLITLVQILNGTYTPPAPRTRKDTP